MTELQNRATIFTIYYLMAGILLTITVSMADKEFKCHNKIDLVVVLDSSGSVTRKQFKMSKNLVADLVKHFDISRGKTNVAVATYSQYAHVGRTFQEYASLDSVLESIGRLRYEGAASRLDFGFGLVQFKLFETQYGSRPSNTGVKKVAVFITDGYSTRGLEFTSDSTATLKRKGVELFSIGISNHINKKELDALASRPRKTHQLYLSDLAGNSFTKEQVQSLAKEICKSK